ncbi:hypothetical protein HPB50_009491 [Hyalomma asiaticum]|uniref:Uncharacterized protein n=1 Tax=Hyalomma asiaticum TaxID=266040 RepID=A0ACB7SCA9_HYAAI|nr:hypothetical protein HPB50_009491 [Hyalomma asiaticum]
MRPLNWRRAELNKIDALLRKGLKAALRLPISTSNEKLMQLGLHNSAQEIFEAQRTAQIARLSSTLAGHKILQDANISPIYKPEEKSKLPKDVRAHLNVEPVPRNTHPVHNEGRRRDKIRKHNHSLWHNTHALFVDAAKYAGRQAYVAAVTDAEGKLLTAASVRTRHTHEAEELAIALALQSSKAHSKIHTDSKTAARTFAAALVSKQTANLATKAIHKYT